MTRAPASVGDVAAALDAVRRRIGEAEGRFSRAPGSVRLLAVSKAKPVAAIRAAARAGQRAFGENYLQEAEAKIAALADLAEPLEWHFIGAIQSNKTAVISRCFDWAHCVDRAKIARRLSDGRPAGALPLNVCIQVNVSGETSKSGVAPAEVGPLAEVVASLPGLALRGLMALPRPTADFDAQRAPFQALRTLLQTLRARHPRLDTLSMGMSDDLEAAVAEGSTLVRVGTAIFGERS